MNCFEKKTKEYLTGSFKYVCTVAVQYWYIKNAFAGFFQEIFEKFFFRRHYVEILLLASNAHILTPLFRSHWKSLRDFKLGKVVLFFINLDPHNSSRINRQRVVNPRKKFCFVPGISLIWKSMEYRNDQSPNAPILPTY